MFKDIDVSKDLMSGYKEKEGTDVDLGVTVLTTGYWPGYTADNAVVIPTQVRFGADFG